MIEVEHLSKSYGPVEAVRDVSFRVARGEVVGFLGPNGAGKSTTLRILAGFLGATRGRVRIAGHDLAEEPLLARAAVGYMPEMSPLYPELRVVEYLAFRAELKVSARRERKAAVERALSDARIEHMADVLIGHLSKGYRQRVGLADALVGSPPLLILDEPTAGLDPNQIRDVRALIRRLGEDRTVLLSTHILPEIEATCSRALVIARGRLVAEGSIDELRALRRTSGLRVGVRGDVDRALAAVRAVEGVAGAALDLAHANADLSTLAVELAPSADAVAVAEDLLDALVAAAVKVHELAPRSASLEQVFSELTEADADASDDGDVAAEEPLS